MLGGCDDYIYGPSGTPVEQVNLLTSTPTYMTYAASDSTWLTTSSAGNQTGFWGYDAFGNLAFGTPTSPFGYSGQYTDASTGLVNDRARFYEPQTGSFTTRDPAFASTDTAYTYTGGDPVNNSDPTGLLGIQTPFGCIGNCGPPNHTTQSQGTSNAPPYRAPVTIMNENYEQTISVYGGGPALNIYITNDLTVVDPYLGQTAFQICAVGTANQCQIVSEAAGRTWHVRIPSSDASWAITPVPGACNQTELTGLYQFTLKAWQPNLSDTPDYSVVVASKQPVFNISSDG